MAYRRRQGLGRSATFKEEMYRPPDDPAASSSLADQASANARPTALRQQHTQGGGPTYDYTSMGSSNEAGSFWGVLARKAKAILEEDSESERIASSTIPEEPGSFKTMDNPTLRKLKGTDALASSMNHMGDTASEMMAENKTENLMQEPRMLQIRRKGLNSEEQNPTSEQQQSSSSLNQTSREDQLKASRDVAMATAAKAKLLLRELKTVKAELAFSKQRCSQLEEENKILREAREKGVNPADDDMIRRQLETLLEEKARLAHENSVYARENRYLREIVEYHQLSMQDLVDLDEGMEEVIEVCPVAAGGASNARMRLCVSASVSPPSSPNSNSSSMRLYRAASAEAAEIPKMMLTKLAAAAAPQDAIRQ
ncbi:uncharacterized protein LOC127250812 [Andrographis paniculata]|uniref:uncharacterized protein LOC127250812 n=1 Tax=Andrographis paniculata TaxID=175694 RepID=UPI0021E7A013|nr:uncharacterized protein LOC127250812 [Andrographis paniculata]